MPEKIVHNLPSSFLKISYSFSVVNIVKLQTVFSAVGASLSKMIHILSRRLDPTKGMTQAEDPPIFSLS